MRALARMALCTGMVGVCCIGSSPPSRYYTLSTLPRPEAAAGASTGTVRVAPVSLPESLERPQMVRRTGANTVEVLEFERWIEPLDVLLRNTLVADLASLLPATDVVGASAPGVEDRTVVVNIQALEATTAGEVRLEAVWFVLAKGADAPERTRQTSVREEARSGQPAEVAAATSRAVERLSRDIAAQIGSSR
jgi:uncharacterized lipoprotein YmbA